MGGGRKKGSSSSSGRHYKSSPPQQQRKQHIHAKNKVDDQLSQCMHMEEVSLSDGRNGFLAWKDSLLFLLLVPLAILTSVGLGIAAGMTVSIHYYEEAGSTTMLHRITSLDNDIRSQNIPGLRTGRVSVMSDDEDDELVVQELPPLDHLEQPESSTDSNHTQPAPGIVLSEPTVHPTLCSDGVTMGFQDWSSLKAAIREANSLSAERFLRWNEFIAAQDGKAEFEDSTLYYEEDVFITICPGATLKARKGPIFINAENIVLECDGCTIDVGGSHLNFGPHARNVLVRGVTFKGAHSSSLTFYHDGSEASFEDCYWYGNSGNGKSGAVADVNSTSSVVFYRCEIDDANNVARYSRGQQQGLASSLSIRA